MLEYYWVTETYMVLVFTNKDIYNVKNYLSMFNENWFYYDFALAFNIFMFGVYYFP